MSEKNGEQKRQTNDKGRSLVEWITLGISVTILLVVAGLVVYESQVDDDQPTVIEVRPAFDELRQEQGHFYLPVAVTNNGNRTVSALQVEIRLMGPDGAVQSSSLDIDFLAGGASVGGVVVFGEQPTPENVGFVASYRRQ